MNCNLNFLSLAQGVRRSKATPSRTAQPVAPSERSANPLGLDFSCFGTKSTPIPDPARRGIKLQQLLALKAFIEKHAEDSVAEKEHKRRKINRVVTGARVDVAPRLAAGVEPCQPVVGQCADGQCAG